MSVLLFTHPACFDHDPGAGHPESPARLRAVLDALANGDGIETREAPRASRGQLLRVHDAAHLDFVEACAPAVGTHRLDADTLMSPGSLEAALRAAGACCAAVDAVIAGPVRRAFCAVRPPGHHATRGEAMGFCLFNNIAVAAAHALEVHGLARVAIADFDVHHGNGSEDIVAGDARILFASSHQVPLYPGTGAPGRHGNALDAALPPGSGSAAFRAAWEDTLLPAIDAFAPQLLLVSAGFDAERRDPLAQIELGPADFAWIGARLAELADRHAHGRLVASLEGGYALDALAEGASAFVHALH
jgi:acetoin utilization deacetylase AcuC-like enzyme